MKIYLLINKSKKHKPTKVSIITDDFNIPISVVTSTGATNDSLILNNQIDILHTNHPIIFNERYVYNHVFLMLFIIISYNLYNFI